MQIQEQLESGSTWGKTSLKQGLHSKLFQPYEKIQFDFNENVEDKQLRLILHLKRSTEKWN